MKKKNFILIGILIFIIITSFLFTSNFEYIFNRIESLLKFNILPFYEVNSDKVNDFKESILDVITNQLNNFISYFKSWESFINACSNGLVNLLNLLLDLIYYLSQSANILLHFYLCLLFNFSSVNEKYSYSLSAYFLSSFIFTTIQIFVKTKHSIKVFINENKYILKLYTLLFLLLSGYLFIFVLEFVIFISNYAVA